MQLNASLPEEEVGEENQEEEEDEDNNVPVKKEENFQSLPKRYLRIKEKCFLLISQKKN